MPEHDSATPAFVTAAAASRWQLPAGAWPTVLDERWKKAEKLGDRLGDLHDIPVLAETIEKENIGGKAERKFARKVMRRKRRKLSAECLEDAERLFRPSPAQAARDVAVHYALAASASGARPLVAIPFSVRKRGKARA